MAEIIEMPKLSDTMTTGTLVNWLVKEGDAVSAGTMLAEVETDKATMEVENFEDGVVLKLYAKEGDSVAIGGPICAVGEKGEKAPDVGGGKSKEEAPAKKEKKEEPKNESGEKPEKAVKEEKKESESGDKKEAAKSESSESKKETSSLKEDSKEKADEGEKRLRISPLARKIAEEKGVDILAIEGSGPGGRIIKDDVLAAEKAPKPAPANVATSSTAVPVAPVDKLEEKTIPVTNMRSAIARALVSSKTEAPHFYLQTEVNGAPIAELRKALNDRLADLPPEQGGVKFTVNDLILKASAEAVRRVPAINRSWKGDSIIQHGSVHLAFGVAVDDGLLTPVIRDAQSKSLRAIASEAKDLIKKARGKKLKPDEMSNSTLTVTNLGMFGITDFYGIINPPNAAILSVGATVKTPVVDDKGQITVGYRMKVGLSGDHRVIDGAVGAQYLAALREILETPALMLV